MTAVVAPVDDGQVGVDDRAAALAEEASELGCGPRRAAPSRSRPACVANGATRRNTPTRATPCIRICRSGRGRVRAGERRRVERRRRQVAARISARAVGREGGPDLVGSVSGDWTKTVPPSTSPPSGLPCAEGRHVVERHEVDPLELARGSGSARRRWSGSSVVGRPFFSEP